MPTVTADAVVQANLIWLSMAINEEKTMYYNVLLYMFSWLQERYLWSIKCYTFTGLTYTFN